MVNLVFESDKSEFISAGIAQMIGYGDDWVSIIFRSRIPCSQSVSTDALFLAASLFFHQVPIIQLSFEMRCLNDDIVAENGKICVKEVIKTLSIIKYVTLQVDYFFDMINILCSQ